MLVKDFFTLCRAGVIKQFALDEPSIFAFLNLGITELHKKFDLAMREQIIELSSSRKEYKLLADVMRVVSVYTDEKFLGGYTSRMQESKIVELPLNDDNDPFSVYTPSTGILLVPTPQDNQVLSVLYKATSHTYTPADLEEELDIGAQYITPLVLYIGYSATLGLETVPGQSMAALSMFNQACTDIENYGLYTTSTGVSDKLHMRGFV